MTCRYSGNIRRILPNIAVEFAQYFSLAGDMGQTLNAHISAKILADFSTSINSASTGLQDRIQAQFRWRFFPMKNLTPVPTPCGANRHAKALR